VNPWTGVFSTYSTGSGDAIFKRCQVNQTDMSSVAFPGAHWISEGVYVSTRDAQSGNRNNNASYRLVTNTGNGATLTPTGAQFWQFGDPGVRPRPGRAVPDTSVTLRRRPERRYWFAGKAKDNGNGTWRYEYAVFNLSSEWRAGCSRSPCPRAWR
jgi:hypothetical protein